MEKGVADIEKGIFIALDATKNKIITIVDDINSNYINNLLESTKKYENNIR